MKATLTFVPPLVLLALTIGARAAETLPTTVPARVGDERYVRASYTRTLKRIDRVVLRGHLRVNEVDADGNETAGALEVERCAHFPDGVETHLVPPGTRLRLTRASRVRIDVAREDGRPIDDDARRWLSLVAGLRGGRDDLALWDGDRVNEERLRRIIATAAFDMADVRSRVEIKRGDVAARLSIPQMTGKAADSRLRNGAFALEGRWRVSEGPLERFRRTRWELHNPDLQIVEIVGIESATPDAWWAKSEDQVRAEAEKLAATDDPLLGFYRLRDAKAEIEKDPITELIKVK